MLVGHRIFVCIYDKYHFLCFIKMIKNRKLQNKVYNLNLKTCLLYIRSFYVYTIVMIRGYWFWIHVCISMGTTIFSIIHICTWLFASVFWFGISWFGKKLILRKFTCWILKEIDSRFSVWQRFLDKRYMDKNFFTLMCMI